jgi:hypothetical protein
MIAAGSSGRCADGGADDPSPQVPIVRCVTAFNADAAAQIGVSA